MDIKKVNYSILKYRPNIILDEQINIGIFFHFIEENLLKFIYPENLSRINKVFLNNNINHKKHLEFFQNKVESFQINNKDSIVILNTLLVPDSNCYYFSDIKNTIYKNKNEFIEKYKKTYFVSYL